MKRLISGAGKPPCDLPAPSKTARKNNEEDTISCTLCGGDVLELICPDNDHRCYYHCQTCQLIFASPVFFPNREREISRYREHNNGIDQPGYVAFLERIINPAFSFIPPGAIGLDYGCGPVPTLSKLVNRRGDVKCYDYDPLFDFDHPGEVYDFIFSTECLEHFHHPHAELEKILDLLKPGGHLFLMTERWESVKRFLTWYYKTDPTHVSFYHRDTFDYITAHYGLTELLSDRNRIMILKYNE